jgi:hypothetical protein
VGDTVDISESLEEYVFTAPDLKSSDILRLNSDENSTVSCLTIDTSDAVDILAAMNSTTKISLKTNENGPSDSSNTIENVDAMIIDSDYDFDELPLDSGELLQINNALLPLEDPIVQQALECFVRNEEIFTSKAYKFYFLRNRELVGLIVNTFFRTFNGIEKTDTTFYPLLQETSDCECQLPIEQRIKIPSRQVLIETLRTYYMQIISNPDCHDLLASDQSITITFMERLIEYAVLYFKTINVRKERTKETVTELLEHMRLNLGYALSMFDLLSVAKLCCRNCIVVNDEDYVIHHIWYENAPITWLFRYSNTTCSFLSAELTSKLLESLSG